MQEHGFEWELRNLLYGFGYLRNQGDPAYFDFPPSGGEEERETGKLFEAIQDALERGL